jgi:hypothetical protein
VIKERANEAFTAMHSGNQDRAQLAAGAASHTIQDSYAHTTRDAQGEITHIECFTRCGAGGSDHHDPTVLQPNGSLTPEGDGAVAATTAFVELVSGAGSMTFDEFNAALNNYVDKFFSTTIAAQGPTTPSKAE